MNYNIYHPKEKLLEKNRSGEIFQTRRNKQISNAFNLLSSLHNYTLADGFLLFDLDQSNICIEIFKR